MYTKSIHILNYGPISQLAIGFPFDGITPKPVVLVGQNGSGKSIVLSHIVNGLVAAKGRAYPETPEVETGQVFKLRSPHYIRLSDEWCYAKVDYEHDLFMGELTARRRKQEYGDTPPEFPTDQVKNVWDQMPADRNSHLISNIDRSKASEIRDVFDKSCVLYFPHNRFEEPAWLNEDNLKAKAEYMDIRHIQDATNRKLINYSSLQDNQNWLFDVAYDMSVFENRTENLVVSDQDRNQVRVIQEWKGFHGPSTAVFEIALDVVRHIMRGNSNATLKIGDRLNRVVSLWSGGARTVPNIFQLSSGETSLLNLFLSILRDFNLSGATFDSATDIRGIAVVDEVDLHLHTIHQYQILPSLIQMFPNVQFVVTTHSPLFVLGMNTVFGESGFALYRLPDGHQIDPEEFGEFGNAYKVFSSTSKFSDDVRLAVKNAQRPVLYMEGDTDIMYLRRAAELLGHDVVVEAVDLQDGGGDRLKSVWKAVSVLPEQLVPRSVVVLFDCDYPGEPEDKGHRFKRKIPLQDGHPINKGIENLFDKATLQKARKCKPAFIDVAEAHSFMKRGEAVQILEEWTVNGNEKTNLCKWLCQNGTAEDFRHFEVVFDLLNQLLGEEEAN